MLPGAPPDAPWAVHSPARRPPGAALPGPGEQMNVQNSQDDFGDENEKEPDFTWEVKANDCDYNRQFKKSFLCWKRRKYSGNAIKTAKYNLLTFLPLNLYEQFHRTANLYFLFVILLQTIPEIATLPWFALLLPLSCLLIIRGSRDLVDDIARHRSDQMINGRPCEILLGKSFCKKSWQDIQVGDIVCLQKDDFVPADLLLLASSEPSSLCYVETADIDGETNLKFRQAPIITHTELVNTEKMAAFDGMVVCEEPNSRMHTFVGTLEWKGEKYPLDSEKILLRGCRIRNTDICYGLVIYAGFDSKIMRNCGKIQVKRTKLDKMMNNLVIIIFLMLVVVSFCLAVFYRFQVVDFQTKHSYLVAFHSNSSPAQEAFLNFWGFMILFSVIVPMSLYITFEFIYLVNSCFINWDLEMYYSPLDMPAKARSTSLNDQLGQIEYIFSDKTGTLTQNIMTFKKCCISGLTYGTDENIGENLKAISLSWNKYADGKLLFYDPTLLIAIRDDKDKVIREFWRLLALCHTVMVEEKDGQLVYQAASPDEEALVTAARNFGYVFLSRTQDTITTSELGVERTYQVLAMMDFNSVRKRMSVLLRDPEGIIRLYTKGADTVIFERLRPGCPNELATEKALDTFAEETLRTLCLASREVEEEAYQEWRKRYNEARVLLQHRAQALSAVYEDMEKDLTNRRCKFGVGVLAADIGVGISGQEGMQAVQCSDYAVAQFAYLQRLLLVHGRWSYLRVCKFLRYFFYKTFASMSVQIWFAFYSGFTAQPLYEGWFLAFYNIFYTAYPVLSMGLLEQDMSVKKCLEFPELYSVGQKNQLFNYWVFFVAVAHGIAASLVNFYVTLWAFNDTAGPGGICDYQSFGATVATSALLSVIAEIAMDIKFWTVLSILAIVSTVALYSLISFLTQNFFIFRVAPTMFRFPGATQNALTEPYILLVVLLTVAVNTIPSLAVRLLCHITAEPTPGKSSYQASQVEVTTVELKGHFQRGSTCRRSSYAFSHKEGYADLISGGSSLRKKPPQNIQGPSWNQDLQTVGKAPSSPRTSGLAKESP
ncbi:phospholipid-transporting ATPase IK [Petaurus breviceps papuanus]|uniref:phospholipid-transporting ATPase IK n=1 Tax=Petaurus breviceps papuanus TaxID=3040969 RepID=UPI0036D7891E